MPQQTRTAPIVTCPTCGRQTPWQRDNPYRPFCSERCKLIDLGQWATESYRIPEAPANPHEMDLEE